MALTGAHPNHSQFLHPTVSSSGTLPQFTIGQQSTPTTVDSSAMALHSLMAAAAAAASGNSMSGFSSLSSVGQSSMEQFMAAGGAMATSQQDAALFFKAAALQASFAAAASGVATDSGPSSTSSSSNLAPSVNSLSDLTERRSVDVDQSCESHQVDTVKSEATLSPPPSSTHDHSPPTSMGRPTSISPPTTALGGHTTPLQKLQSLSPNTIIGEQFAAAAAAAGRSLKFSIDNILSPNFGTQVEQAARSMMLQAHYGAAVAAAAAAASHPTAHLTSANQAANPLLAFYQQMQEKYVSQQLALVNQSLQLQQQQQQQAALAAATAHFQQQQQQRAFAHPFGAPHSMPVTHQAPIPVQSKLGFDINAINNNNTLLNRKNSTTTHHVESRKRKRSDSESSTISSLSAQSKENPMAPTHSPKMIKREETAKLPKPVSKPCDDIKRSNPPPSATDSNPDADSLDKPLDEKIKQPTLWPAWVYCTRYSDRPSSGPRSRKMPKKPKEKKQTDEKRPRTAFTAEQLARLKQEFQENRYLNEKRRQDLARDLKLNESQIKIWFQNKRAKIKKSTGNRNPLALHLMAQGLYNHSTMAMDGEEDEEMDGDDDDDARSHGDNAPNSPNE